MSPTADSAAYKQIAELLAAINDAWLGGRTEELNRYFDENVVFLHPDFSTRTAGVDPAVDSYRQFVTQAVIKSFRPSEPLIDVFGSTAVAAYEFEIEYEIGGQFYREAGQEIFVFRQKEELWKAVWRTLSFRRLFPATAS